MLPVCLVFSIIEPGRLVMTFLRREIRLGFIDGTWLLRELLVYLHFAMMQNEAKDLDKIKLLPTWPELARYFVGPSRWISL